MRIGELGKNHGLSRSTLLYYDRIGLLRPTGRRENRYRDYTKRDQERLREICLYRQTGLPLSEIRKVLDRPRKELAAVLENQLKELARQIDLLRNRQQVIIGLMRNRKALDQVSVMNKATWVRLLRAAGFDDAAMDRWHRDFERVDPEQHERFLQFLGISAREIKAIRAGARGDAS